MKRTVSVLVIICIVLSLFSSCSKNDEALRIGSYKISKDIYGYFYAEACFNKKYEDVKDKKKLAGELCREFTAGSVLCAENSVKLTNKQKVDVAGEVKGRWQSFSSFYEKYSVTKQTLEKMISYEKRIENLTSELYGIEAKGGLSEKQVQNFFYKNYAAVKIISADFKDENGREMTKKQVEQVTEKFTKMRNSLKSGADMAQVAEAYLDLVDYEDKIQLMRFDDTAHPEGMFKKVASMKDSDAQVFRYSTGIYLVLKINMKENPENYFDVYKNECVYLMKKNDLENRVKSLAESYKIVYNQKVIRKVG